MTPEFSNISALNLQKTLSMDIFEKARIWTSRTLRSCFNLEELTMYLPKYSFAVLLSLFLGTQTYAEVPRTDWGTPSLQGTGISER